MPEQAQHQDGVRLEYRTPAGGRSAVRAEGGPWSATGAGLSVRPLRGGDGTALMEQWSVTPGPGRPDPATIRMLENEIRAALRLTRRFGPSYPDGLPHLVGYDLDADLPYLLRKPAFGKPVSALAGRLLLNQLHGFQTALFRALTLLAEAGVVHGGLRPGVVRWDGREICLIGFGSAVAAGERYRQDVASPWMPPSATRDVVADPGDDVWAAGLVVAHVVTGLPVESLRSGGETAEGSSLASLLDGVFADEPRRRPGAAQILRRLGDPLPIDAASRPDAGLDAGRAAFDADRQLKREAAAPRQASASSASGGGRAARTTLLAVLGAVLAVGLVLIGWQVLA